MICAFSSSRIEVELNTSRPTIALWKALFDAKGMAGVEMLHKGSKPCTVTPAVQDKVLRKKMLPPEVGSTHWSYRKMATALGMDAIPQDRPSA